MTHLAQLIQQQFQQQLSLKDDSSNVRYQHVKNQNLKNQNLDAQLIFLNQQERYFQLATESISFVDQTQETHLVNLSDFLMGGELTATLISFASEIGADADVAISLWHKALVIQLLTSLVASRLIFSALPHLHLDNIWVRLTQRGHIIEVQLRHSQKSIVEEEAILDDRLQCFIAAFENEFINLFHQEGLATRRFKGHIANGIALAVAKLYKKPIHIAFAQQLQDATTQWLQRIYPQDAPLVDVHCANNGALGIIYLHRQVCCMKYKSQKSLNVHCGSCYLTSADILLQNAASKL